MPKLSVSVIEDPFAGPRKDTEAPAEYAVVLDDMNVDFQTYKNKSSVIIRSPNRGEEEFPVYLRFSANELRTFTLRLIQMCAAEDISL